MLLFKYKYTAECAESSFCLQHILHNNFPSHLLHSQLTLTTLYITFIGGVQSRTVSLLWLPEAGDSRLLTPNGKTRLLILPVTLSRLKTKVPFDHTHSGHMFRFQSSQNYLFNFFI